MPPSGTGFTAIASGGFLTGSALTASGSIVFWGGSVSAVTPPGTGFTAIATCADLDVYALTSDGQIVAWGSNSSGRASPPSGTGFTAIAGNARGGIALRGASQGVAVPEPASTALAILGLAALARLARKK